MIRFRYNLQTIEQLHTLKFLNEQDYDLERLQEVPSGQRAQAFADEVRHGEHPHGPRRLPLPEH